MLNRVQRELSTVHPLSLYRKQNIPRPTAQSPRARLYQSFNFFNGGIASTSEPQANNPGAKRKIQKIINEVREKRELRDRKKSELQGLGGSDLELDGFPDPELMKTKYYKEKLAVYNFLNSPQVNVNISSIGFSKQRCVYLIPS